MPFNYHDLHIANATLRLLPELAAVWLEERTLFLADVHLGRSAANRSAGIFMPQGTDAADLQRITRLVEEHAIQRVVILGDLFHARLGMASDTIAIFGEWIDKLDREVILVEGNHDRNARRYDPNWPMVIHREPIELGGFLCSHEPYARTGCYTLCGHLHPGIKTRDAAGCALKAKAFWQSADQFVLPAFGSTTSLENVKLNVGDRLYVCAEGRVVPLAPKREPQETVRSTRRRAR